MGPNSEQEGRRDREKRQRLCPLDTGYRGGPSTLTLTWKTELRAGTIQQSQ